jgi:hypothetical protein
MSEEELKEVMNDILELEKLIAKCWVRLVIT